MSRKNIDLTSKVNEELESNERLLPSRQKSLMYIGDPAEGDPEDGDPEDGDPEDGDPEGDPADYGDPLIDLTQDWVGKGDPEQGAPARKRGFKRRFPVGAVQRGKRIAVAKKAYANKSGALQLTDRIQFQQFYGCAYYTGPLTEQSNLSVDALRYALDKASYETPFSQLTVTNTGSGSITLNAANAAFASQMGDGTKLIPFLIFQFGSSLLNNIPNAKITIDFVDSMGVAASPITIQGTLFRSATAYDPANPLVVSISNKATGTVVLVPFIKIKDSVLPTMLTMTAAGGAVTVGGFQVTLSGLPANSTATLIIPGGLSKAVNRLRQRIRKALVS